MSTLALFGVDGIRYLDEISDMNLVYYFRIELNRINKGQFTNMSSGDKKRLIKTGIVLYTKPGVWELSPKGKRLLNQVNIKYKP